MDELACPACETTVGRRDGLHAHLEYEHNIQSEAVRESLVRRAHMQARPREYVHRDKVVPVERLEMLQTAIRTMLDDSIDYGSVHPTPVPEKYKPYTALLDDIEALKDGFVPFNDLSFVESTTQGFPQPCPICGAEWEEVEGEFMTRFEPSCSCPHIKDLRIHKG